MADVSNNDIRLPAGSCRLRTLSAPRQPDAEREGADSKRPERPRTRSARQRERRVRREPWPAGSPVLRLEPLRGRRRGMEERARVARLYHRRYRTVVDLEPDLRDAGRAVRGEMS